MIIIVEMIFLVIIIGILIDKFNDRYNTPSSNQHNVHTYHTPQYATTINVKPPEITRSVKPPETFIKQQRNKMTREFRQSIMKRDNYTCKMCGKYMPDEVGLHIDHIIPVSKWGESIPSNLQVLCSKCNGKKSAKLSSVPKTHKISNNKSDLLKSSLKGLDKIEETGIKIQGDATYNSYDKSVYDYLK